jgi:thiamine biosynthesis protein ThiS
LYFLHLFGAALCHAMRLASTLHTPIGSRTMDVDETIAIRVNGEPRQVAGGLSIAEMVSSLGLDPVRLAVERNREIVPRSLLGQVRVEAGDEYEIVHFVGGG